ncbi:MAG: hypothetical protein FWH18_11435 [Marinilabiliaceae bacterium]|nr:hypothetical protein [Marinilabiliaceae bacterium]
MATFLFKDIIVGPVQSRRLGTSLGVNLLPRNRKICSFNCAYCECGFNSPKKTIVENFPDISEVVKCLEQKLKDISEKGEKLDFITFAGNGEPTLHPSFAHIIDETIRLRDAIYPSARVAVLSNGTRIDIPNVFAALQKVDYNIQKIDSAIPETIYILNSPCSFFELERTLYFLKNFSGKVILQTLLLKGNINRFHIDNTTETEVDALINLYKKVSPRFVMLYTLARDTPVETLEKIAPQQMDQIAEKLKKNDIEVQVTY